jgi:hypothetical protein
MKKLMSLVAVLAIGSFLAAPAALACDGKKAEGAKKGCCAKGEKAEKTAAKADHCAGAKSADATKERKPAAPAEGEKAKADTAEKKS